MLPSTRDQDRELSNKLARQVAIIWIDIKFVSLARDSRDKYKLSDLDQDQDRDQAQEINKRLARQVAIITIEWLQFQLFD